MKKLTLILSSLLAVQTLLAALLFTFKTDSGAFQSDKSLLDLNAAAFDTIAIEQKDKAPLTLKKDKEQWFLPGYFNVPVDSAKIIDLTGKLLGQKTSWPVANTEEAAERFLVNKDKFERKLVFQKDSKAIKTLYLGTSPGFKKIHARVDGQNDIQAIEFSAFEVSVTPEDWMKQDLIKIEPAQLSQIKGQGFSLTKADKDWSVEGLQANQSSNTAEIQQFLDKLSGLNYTGILGIDDITEYHLKEPVVSLSLKKQSEELQYQFGKMDGTEDYVLKVSNEPYYFKVAKTQVEGLKDVNLQKLVTEKPAEVANDTKSKTETEKSKAAKK